MKSSDPFGRKAEDSKIVAGKQLHRPVHFLLLHFNRRFAQADAVKETGIMHQGAIPFLPHCADNPPYQLFDLLFPCPSSLDDSAKRLLKAPIASLDNRNPHPRIPCLALSRQLSGFWQTADS